MATLLLKVREVFNSAQDGHVVMSRLCEQMTTFQQGTTENEFWDAFTHHVQKSIIYYKAEPAVERVMDFIANFATYSSRLKQAGSEKVGDSKVEDTPSLTTNSETSEEDESTEPFLLGCFKFLINFNNAREKGVRLRCCQLVNKLLNLLGDEAAIDEELSDSIYECMMVRIKDVYPPVRNQAALALYRLQDPTDEECPVIDSYLNSLSKDIHPLVRKTILSKLAITRKTLPFVIERTQDVKDLIRKTAYSILAQKVSIRALSIAQRIKLVTEGLKNETSQEVRKHCIDMLKAWFRSCNHKFTKLLAALDTESAPESSTLAVENLFKDATLEKLQEYVKQLEEFEGSKHGDVTLIDHKLLTPEIVFFWYSICKHLKTCKDGDVLLQQILPELTHFCAYVRSFAEQNFIDSEDGHVGQSEFILEYLLNIAGLLDLSDEIGRKNLHALVHDLLVLQTVPITLVNTLVKLYKTVETNEDSFVQSLAETISDIKQPLVQVVSQAMKEKTRMLQLQICRLNVNMQECKEDLECAVKQQEFQQASILKDNISEMENQKIEAESSMEECQEQTTKRVECNDDPGTILKCLTVGTAMLAEIMSRGLNSTLMTLKDELFIEGVKNEDPCIRNEAVKGLGLLCLLKREFAAQHLVFFLQVVQVDQDFVKITAVKVIFDLFLMYGITTFNNSTETKDTTTTEDTLTEEEKTTIEGEKTIIEGEKSSDEDKDVTIIPETPDEEQGGDEEKELTAAAESVLGVLLLFLQSESSDLRTVVSEGLAKVMITGRIVSANVLSRLILLWYNPVTEDDVQLRHCLGVFFPAFAFESRKNQDVVEQAFLPTIRVMTNAPDSSPLSHINIGNVIDLFVQLTDVRNLVKVHAQKGSPYSENEYDTYIHDSIAMKLSNEILSDPEDPDIKLFCKAMNQLTICPQNTNVINDLIDLSKQMMTALETNRVAKNSIEKFCKQLQVININETSVNETLTNIAEVQDGTETPNTQQQNDNNDVFEKGGNTVPSSVKVKKVKSSSSRSTVNETQINNAEVQDGTETPNTQEQNDNNDVFEKGGNTVPSSVKVKKVKSSSSRSTVNEIPINNTKVQDGTETSNTQEENDNNDVFEKGGNTVPSNVQVKKVKSSLRSTRSSRNSRNDATFASPSKLQKLNT